MVKNKHSILLTRICVYAFMAVDFACILGGYYVIKWFLSFSRAEIQGLFVPFAITAYSSAVLVTFVLFLLEKLLRNIDKDNVFIDQNVAIIRICSWCCIGEAVICAISTVYYFPFIFLAVAAAFMGLILRVIKNVIEKAIEIKNENDLTI
ncbi:MAG: DUF2975 domain-containing protein [Oscillospiraceae bacterium]